MPSKPKPPKRVKGKRRAMPRRKQLEQQLEAVVKLIVFWRDAQACVLADIDGGRCRGDIQWGHFIPRKSSKYLKFDLATFSQCRGHNFLHDKNDPIFGIWFGKTFGLAAQEALSVEQRAHTGANYDQTVDDLEAMLARYLELFENRYYVELDKASLIAAGYYGDIIAAHAEPQTLAEAERATYGN